MPTSRPHDCVFCGIVRGDVPAHHAYADDDFVGFLDIRPVFPGHVLVVPRRHVDTLPDLPPELIAPLFGAVQRVCD